MNTADFLYVTCRRLWKWHPKI